MPEQRQQAMQQMQGLTNNMAQMMDQMQNVTPQTSAADQQRLASQMQQMQRTMQGMMAQHGLATPTAPSPTFTPGPQPTETHRLWNALLETGLEMHVIPIFATF